MSIVFSFKQSGSCNVLETGGSTRVETSPIYTLRAVALKHYLYDYPSNMATRLTLKHFYQFFVCRREAGVKTQPLPSYPST